MVEFDAKIWKTGSGSYVLTVPKAFVKNRLLKEGEELNVLVRETFKKETPTRALATPPWLGGCSSQLGVSI